MSADVRQVGDLTVMETEKQGFVIYRVLRRNGAIQGWQYVAKKLRFHEAIALARKLARDANVRAWLEAIDGTCEPISLA